MRKNIIYVLIFFIISMVLISMPALAEEQAAVGAIHESPLLTQQQLKEDTDYFFKTIEDTHPNIYFKLSKEDYDNYKQLCYSKINKPMSVEEYSKVLAEEKQSDTNMKEMLSVMRIAQYPGIDELKDCRFLKDWITVQPISSEDINNAFSNFEDLQWLKPIALKNKVVLVGESHWYRNIQLLRNRIFFALNTFDKYPLLVIELPYSNSGFYDYYVGIKDDDESQKFYSNVMYDLVMEQELYELLEHMRQWNKVYPDKRVHIGATDIEHDYQSTLRRIIVPYFQLLNPSFNPDIKKMTVNDLENLFPIFDKYLKEAKIKNLTGTYSFITPQYMECVIENLKSLFLSKKYDFDLHRQRAIIRNLTDPRFFGKFFETGKVMMHGGAYHTATHLQYPKGENFYREGSYLTFDFDLTKKKTFSLYIDGFAYKMGSMANVDLNSSLHCGSGYSDIINRFQTAYKQKLVSSEKYYLMWGEEIGDYEKLILISAYEHNQYPLLIKSINWDKILEKSFSISDELYKKMKNEKYNYDMYDAYIYVPQSEITHVNKKK